MSGNISAPSKGEPLRANWAADVTAAANRHERLLEAGAAHASPNMRGGSSPFPFMLTGGTDSSNAAQFVIYLPSGSIVYEDSALTPSGITALTGATDRYKLTNVGTIGSTAAAATALYLIIYLDTYSAVQSIITTDSSAASTTGNTVLLSVTIGKIFKMTPDTDEIGCVAQQLVRSVIALGQSGSGSGSGTTGVTGSYSFAYDFDGPRSDGKLYAKTKCLTFADGLLTSAAEGNEEVVADTVAHSANPAI